MSGRSGDSGGVEDLVEAGRQAAVLRIRVRPGSRRRGVFGTHAGMLLVGVGAPPEGGKATDETLLTLARWLGVARSRLSVVSGAAGRSKRIAVAGETAEGLRKKLVERLPP